MKPRNYRMVTSQNGAWVLRASTAWMDFATPIFGWMSTFSRWWIAGLIGSLFLAFIFGRETWRRVLWAFFLGSVFLPWGWGLGWVTGFLLTTLVDGMMIQEKKRKQREAIEGVRHESGN